MAHPVTTSTSRATLLRIQPERFWEKRGIMSVLGLDERPSKNQRASDPQTDEVELQRRKGVDRGAFFGARSRDPPPECWRIPETNFRHILKAPPEPRRTVSVGECPNFSAFSPVMHGYPSQSGLPLVLPVGA
jgi:hypothetical protein